MNGKARTLSQVCLIPKPKTGHSVIESPNLWEEAAVT